MIMNSDTRHMPSLNDLSNELLLNIIDYLVQDEYDNLYVTPRPTPLKNLSLVNLRFRCLLRILLMKSIVLIDSAKHNAQSSQWDTTHEAIAYLSKDISLCSSMDTLRIEHVDWVHLDDENTIYDTKSADDIVKFLSETTNLEHLRLRVSGRWSQIFSNAVESWSISSPLCLKNVTTLIIEQSTVSLLQYCPRIEHLGLFNHADSARLNKIDLDRYSKFAPNISHIEASARWSLEEITSLAQAWPKLEHLGVFTIVESEPLMLVDLLADLRKTFRYLKVLKLAEVCMDSFWSGGRITLSKLFRNTCNIDACWARHSEEHEMPWAKFLDEQAGYKLMKDAMETVFCILQDLNECRIGDMTGARRVWSDEPADYSEEYCQNSGGDDDDDDYQTWTLSFNWLNCAELRGSVDGVEGGGWLLRPI
ncbi:hypothetical protein N0V90_003399 [Kalmusia sp. IMI 367209]|nr:hypothetical protein N0V90_003399 [Kalmusia sp. IMI 367209]